MAWQAGFLEIFRGCPKTEDYDGNDRKNKRNSLPDSQ
jgi:hypothetical protein